MFQFNHACSTFASRPPSSFSMQREKPTLLVTIMVGDVLVFNHENRLHNVLQVDSTAYENCIKDSYTQRFTSGNDSVVLKEGRAWFICGVDDHCENGQKLHITTTP
ncbi:hypothetical protein JHK82_045578 [Glycine max]|nr:hypothetical protein JHK86_046008 [Glycine max]KAG4941905.1 hypothetical protein JHK87_045776 [Glycine soja]KAG4952679.1 hypothetical protein JHK85_046546 [Glycine max]KAG5100526.1 hypothetical protein JHK82_045578 [Glycine max]KAG5109111.1 hypothetical protein JHK84_046018 [Glycine max]